MSPDVVIGVVGIVNVILLAFVGWLLRQLSTIRTEQTKLATEVRSELAKLTTEVALVHQEVAPPGTRSLAERVTATETGIAILTSTRRADG